MAFFKKNLPLAYNFLDSYVVYIVDTNETQFLPYNNCLHLFSSPFGDTEKERKRGNG